MVENWPGGSTEEDLQISSNIFSLFYYLSLKKGMVLHSYKLKSPSPKDDLYQVWLKLVQWFLRRRKCEKFTATTTSKGGQIVIRKKIHKIDYFQNMTCGKILFIVDTIFLEVGMKKYRILFLSKYNNLTLH